MSPAVLFEVASSSMIALGGSRRRSQAGWLYPFATSSCPPSILYAAAVGFQDAPSSARSKSSEKGASMSGVRARQPAADASARPRPKIRVGHAQGMARKYRRRRTGSSDASRLRQLVHEAPADPAIADPYLGHARGSGDPVEDQCARQDH